MARAHRALNFLGDCSCTNVRWNAVLKPPNRAASWMGVEVKTRGRGAFPWSHNRSFASSTWHV